MAQTIVRVYDNDTRVIIYGYELLAPLVSSASAAAAAAAADAAAAAADADAADADAAAAQASEESAGAYLDSIEDLIAGIPLDPILPLQAVSVAILQGFSGMAAGRQAYLSEAGKVGLFKWKTGNQSALVTGDPDRVFYYPPTSDTTGASGVWERISNESSRIVYTSGVGCALNSNLLTGGGTEDTVKIQRVLDSADGGPPLLLVIDGPALVGALDVYSNTTIMGIAGGGFYLKNGTNRALLRNANPTGTGAVTDKHISLVNVTFNGNCDNQVGVGSELRREADGTLIGLLQFYGVDDVKLIGCTLIESKSIAAHFSNATNVHIADIYIDNNVPAEAQQGGIQFEGPCSKITIQGVRGSTQDDLIALSPDGGIYVEGIFTGLGPHVDTGDITDVDITGVVGFGNTLSALRFFSSTNRIDRVTVKGITGTFSTALFWNDAAGLTPAGNIGTVTISHVNAHMTNYTGTTVFQTVMGLFGNIDHLILNDITINEAEDNRGLIYIDPNCDIKHLEVDGLRFNDTVDEATSSLIHIGAGGRVRRMDLRAVDWSRGASHVRAGQVIFMDTGGRIDDLFIDGLRCNRVNNVINKTAGTTTDRMTLRNVQHLDPAASTNVLVSQSAGTINVLDVSGYYSDVISNLVFNSGTIAFARGDAFRPWGTAAPTLGWHARGEMVFNTAPAAAGKIGWTCTATGTPGTWKLWGAIDA